MDVKIIDNFLDAYTFNEVQKFIVYNVNFEVFLNTNVTFNEYSGKEEGMMKQEEDNWNFYFGHTFYDNNMPQSPYAEFKLKSEQMLKKMENRHGPFGDAYGVCKCESRSDIRKTRRV